MIIAENIRLNRQKKNMTQEQLANALGVSVQAVSRWETEATYPDITLLPTIACFFDLTIDELMGMSDFKDEKALEEIWEKIKNYSAEGKLDDCIALLRKTLKRFPNNFKLLDYLASQLAWKNGDDEEVKKYRNESMQITERILENCSDQLLKDSAYDRMIFLHEQLGNIEKAIEMAEKLPSISCSYESTLLYLYSGEKQTVHTKWMIYELTNILCRGVQVLSDLEYQNPNMSSEERIEILKKNLSILDVIYDGKDYGFINRTVAQTHRYIAAIEILIDHKEETLLHLELAAKHAILQDTLKENEPYTSVLLKGISYSKKHTMKNYTYTECDELYDRLQGERYNGIRDLPKFKEILEQLQPYITK